MPFDLKDLGWAYQVGLLLAAAAVITYAGSKLAYAADVLAEKTGMGEAIAGAVLLGAATSLPGTLTSGLTAWNGLPSLAYSNAIGGIAAQTLFLVVADAFYRKANLEHAAVSLANIVNAVMLIVLLSMMLSASSGPDITIWAVHPVSIIAIIAYGFGLRFAQQARAEPMWVPTETPETQADEPDDENEGVSTRRTVMVFSIALAAVAVAGYVVAETATGLVNRAGLAQNVVGAFITAPITSLPELVTTMAAVRAGALQLAVGGIIGGNAFDTLFASVADMAYRDGSIYHAISDSDRMLTSAVILITAILLIGLLRREKHGMWGLGVEGVLIPPVYVAVGAAIIFGSLT